MKKIKKICKLICFIFVGIFTLAFSSLSVSAETKGFAFRAFRLNGDIRWKLYNPVAHMNWNGGKFIYPADGTIAFCIEPNIQALLLEDGVYNLERNPMNFGSITGYSNETLEEFELIAYYGYGYNGDTSDVAYLSTQLEIWNTVLPNTIQYVSGDFSEIDAKRQQIRENVANAKVRPSFNMKTQEVILGEETTIIDTNNILSNYEVDKCTNCTAEIIKGQNALKVTATSLGDAKVSLIRKISNSQVGSILYTKDNYQKLMTFSHPAPVNAVLNLNVKGGKIAINKVDSDTDSSTPRGEATLEGAIYGVYKEDGTYITEIRTDKNGYAQSGYLPSIGRFYLQEITPSKGYELDTNKYYFDLTVDNLYPTVKVKEKVIERKYNIIKVFASNKTQIMTPEPNVEFGIYDRNNNLVGTYKTDSEGKFSFTLPYGKYTLKQLSSPAGYEKMQDYEFEIKESGDDINKVFSNAEYTSRIKVIKVDQDGNVITKAGIKFKIKNLDTGKYVCQTVAYPSQKTYCEFETDENGILITPYPLNIGNYQLEEIDQVIDGYLWNPETLKFSINENSNFIYDNDLGAIIELKFSNQEVKGKIELHKVGEKFVIENGKYFYEEVALPNIVFGLYDEDGNFLGEYTTDENGFIEIEDLKLGKYTLKELKTIDGFVLDETVYEIELIYIDQYTPIVTKTFTVKNYLQKGTLEFTKTDLTTGEPIPNVEIKIFTENDELIFVGKTDENGKIIITDLPVGIKMYIIESIPAENYQITDEKIFFEILENGEIVKSEMKNQKIPVPDTGITGINKNDFIYFLSAVVLLCGIGVLMYAKKKK